MVCTATNGIGCHSDSKIFFLKDPYFNMFYLNIIIIFTFSYCTQSFVHILFVSVLARASQKHRSTPLDTPLSIAVRHN